MRSWKIIACWAMGLIPIGAEAQCYAVSQFPPWTITPNPTGNTIIASNSYAGEYALVDLTAGQSYSFNSSNITDHITISSAPSSGALVWGTQPVVYTASASQVYYVHFHTGADCGNQPTNRITTVSINGPPCPVGAYSCGGIDEVISRVSMGAIHNVSGGCGTLGYSDFTSMATSLPIGHSQPITVENSNPFIGSQVHVFVDWDQDLSFDGPGETFVLTTTDHAIFTGSITAPPGALEGPTRMRIRLTWTGPVPPCGFLLYGEVEDYTLNILPSSANRYVGGSGRGDVQLAFAGPAQLFFAGGDGRGDVRLTFPGFGQRFFAGGSGRGDVQLAFPGLGTSLYAGGTGRGDVRLSFPGFAQLQYAGGDGRGDVMLSFDVDLPGQILLALRGVLEGPYSSGTGLMNDALRTLPSFPLTEPYTALGYSHVGGGGETIAPAVLATTGPDAIVDWVLVELRDALDPTTVVASRSGLLQRDGDVVAMDGASPLAFDLPSGSYHVVLLHRNHLGAMTQSEVALDNSATAVDLASASTSTYGTGARKSISGTFPVEALWAGDANFDGVVRYTGAQNDRDPILTLIGGAVPTATLDGYQQEDMNLDGTVKYTGGNNDRDVILQTIGGTVPTSVRVEQVP